MRRGMGILLLLGFVLLARGNAMGETYQLSWNAVTTYTDGTPIEPEKEVRYTAYWSTDPTLASGSLHSLANGISTTSTIIDPVADRMTREQTIYFTAKAILNTGEESPLSPAYEWTASGKHPSVPGNMRVLRIQ